MSIATDDTANESRRIVPFHTGRVAIGCAWQPDPPRMQGDAFALQRALLDPRTERRPSGVRRILSALWRFA